MDLFTVTTNERKVDVPREARFVDGIRSLNEGVVVFCRRLLTIRKTVDVVSSVEMK